MSGTQNRPNMARIGLVTVVGGGLMFAAAQILAKPKEQKVVRAVTRPTARASAGTALPNDTAPVVSVRNGVPSPPPLALAGEPPVRNLFSPLVKPPVEKSTLFNSDKAKGKPIPVVTTPPPTIVKPTAPVKPPVPDAASTMEMMGVVELDDKVQVLLKNRTTGERLYVSKGEEAFGYKVGEIKENSVELIKAGGPGGATAKPEVVAMSTLTIVEGAASPAGAAGPGGAPGVGGPGGPGGPGGRSGMGGGEGRGGRRGGGGRDGNAGGESGGFTTASLFSLPTWTERLKKLEEVKGQMTSDRYDRLKKFMTDRAAAEKK